jgi:hypothetical protein
MTPAATTAPPQTPIIIHMYVLSSGDSKLSQQSSQLALRLLSLFHYCMNTIKDNEHLERVTRPLTRRV